MAKMLSCHVLLTKYLFGLHFLSLPLMVPFDSYHGHNKEIQRHTSVSTNIFGPTTQL